VTTRSRVARAVRWVPQLLLLLGLLSSAPAQAQSAEPIELKWNAPPECPRAEEVRARIRKLAGPLNASKTALRAEATISRNDDDELHLRLVVHVGNETGERHLDGKSCKALAGATAVALVLLLRSSDPLSENPLAEAASTDTRANGGDANNAASGETQTDRGSQTKAPEPVTKPTQPARPPAAAAAAVKGPERRWRILLQFPQAALGIGPLRKPSFGLAAAGGLSFDRWRFLARGSYWFPQEVTTDNMKQQFSAEVRRASGSLLACRALSLSTLELAPCAKVTIEHVSARASGPHISATDAGATWIAAGFGAHARWHIVPWLALFAAIEAELEGSRPQFSLDEVGPFQRFLPAAVAGSIGTEWIM